MWRKKEATWVEMAREKKAARGVCSPPKTGASRRREGGARRGVQRNGRDSPIDICSVAIALVVDGRGGSRSCHVERLRLRLRRHYGPQKRSARTRKLPIRNEKRLRASTWTEWWRRNEGRNAPGCTRDSCLTGKKSGASVRDKGRQLTVQYSAVQPKFSKSVWAQRVIAVCYKTNADGKRGVGRYAGGRNGGRGRVGAWSWSWSWSLSWVVVVARDSLARMRDWKGKKRRLKINKKNRKKGSIF